ncbi:hypothetical protein SNE40_023007 [Patella caerulea]|uniref:Presequence protease, mitochondrial n=1 Tax=Patella caerulea TaxID=87958 RepID=A0AAN8G5E7_PATCE
MLRRESQTALHRVVCCYRRFSTKTNKAREAVQVYKPGQKLHGYTVKQLVDIPELYLTAVTLQHDKTQAQHLHAAREDDNNLFSVSFRTTPMDSTGVPHILEHTALCGSKKYPVRDPFFKMLSRSLATFMNAFTADDWTMYPFSSQNYQDFQNLLSVYMDAAFYPKLRELDFFQEGWRLEHEDPTNPKSPIIFKGIVYNEMKGVFSSSRSIYTQEAYNKLLPSHTYGVVSGGDPKYITDLTWQQLKDFHASHYHPSNSRFFTYGNFPLQDHLQFINDKYLQHFNQISVNTSVPFEPRWTNPRKGKIDCAPDPLAADPNKQTTVSVSYLLADATDSFEAFTMSIIGHLLVGGETSPFYKSLLEANIGNDYAPTLGYDGYRKESVFSVGLQGIAKQDEEKVFQIISDTFDKVIKDGFEQERIDAVLHQIELGQKHQSGNFGLGLSMAVTSIWNHDGNPTESLQINKHVNMFKQKLADNPTFLQDKVQQYFKTNNHSYSLTMSPDEKFEENRKEEEKKRLEKKVKELSDEEKQVVYNRGLQLMEKQNEEENLTCLPTLTLADLDRKIKPEPVETTSLGGVPVLCSIQPTNEVTYIRMICNINNIPSHLIPYVTLFSSILTQMGAGDYDYKRLSQEIELYTGGLATSPLISPHHTQPNTYEKGLHFNSYCLDKNVDKLLDLWSAIFNRPDFSDLNRLTTLIRMEASDLAMGLADSGHRYAMGHSAASLSPADNLSETLNGMTQVSFMKKIAEKTDQEETLEKLKELAEFILNKDSLRILINATPEHMSQVVKSVDRFLQEIPGNHSSSYNHVNEESFKINPLNTQFELPFSVNYVAKSCQTVQSTHEDFASLRVLASLLSRKYLHREIREKGGAYGSGASCSSDVFTFYSYRDPNSTQTMDVFNQSVQWATNSKFTDQDIDEAKLGVFQQIDKPIPPGKRGMLLFTNQRTDEMRQKSRDELFSVSRDDIVAVANRYLKDNQKPTSLTFLGPTNEQIKSNQDKWKIIKD